MSKILENFWMLSIVRYIWTSSELPDFMFHTCIAPEFSDYASGNPPIAVRECRNCNMWLSVEHSPEKIGRTTSHKKYNVRRIYWRTAKMGTLGFAQENTSLCIGLKYARYADNSDRPFPKSIVCMGLLWPARAWLPIPT